MEGFLRELSIVILSHNRREELEITFLGLCEIMNDAGFELIIVDNASSDGSVQLIDETIQKYPSVRFVKNASNLGVGGGRNAGWEFATRPFIVNLDDDTRVSPAQLTALLEGTKVCPEAGITFPRVVDLHTQKLVTPEYGSTDAAANFCGGCHVVRRSAYSKVGLLDVDCTFGGEELDYSFRMRAAGWDVQYLPNVTVFHNGLVRGGDLGRQRRREWTRNAVRINFKHLPFHTATLFAWRLTMSQWVSGSRLFGLAFSVSIFEAAVRGAQQGMSAHQTMPKTVVKLYRRRDLQPDLGNVPLRRKALARLKAERRR
jgi:N-acetylglucosaminyl-diphospho-decaprenol L-rhamnosyltransferase